MISVLNIESIKSLLLHCIGIKIFTDNSFGQKLNFDRMAMIFLAVSIKVEVITLDPVMCFVIN